MKDAFLAGLAEAEKTTPDIMSFVYDQINGALWQQKFAEIDEIFEKVDPKTISIDAAVAMLCYSLSAKNNLPGRGAFLKKAIAHCAELEGPKAALENFAGLE